MSNGASTSAAALQPPDRLHARAGDKRLRSWDVDVSLDELVEWDALEQFMSEMPTDASGRPGSGISRSVSRTASCDPSLGALGTLGARALGPMGCVGGVPRSVSNDSVGAALGFGGANSLGGSTGLVPGAWPMMTSLGGGQMSAGMPPGLPPGLPPAATGNAASLAQSLYASWQQPSSWPQQPNFPLQALPMERGVSWGAELLPFMEVGDAAGLVDSAAVRAGRESPNSSETQQNGMMPHPLNSPGAGSGGAGGISADDSAPGRSVQKQRFVWTSELHRRFEAAVNTLGVDQAKPQAISQLMNCEGEGAPTRQNIKSHLQKYRLLLQKRAKQGGGANGAGSSGGDGDSMGLGGPTSGNGCGDGPTDVRSELEQHLARQEMNLRVQMDLQTKLHRQLLVQRQLQHQLEHCFPASDGDDRQRYQATLSLKNSLRERLTTHVMLQQEMLQHLDALVSSEATKAGGEEGGTSAADAADAAAGDDAATVDRTASSDTNNSGVSESASGASNSTTDTTPTENGAPASSRPPAADDAADATATNSCSAGGGYSAMRACSASSSEDLPEAAETL